MGWTPAGRCGTNCPVNDTQVKTRLTRAEVDRLKHLAAKDELSISRYVRKVLRERLAQEEYMQAVAEGRA